MASNSETGHAVNISNFKKLIDICASFGVGYNPSNTDLTIANMTTQWTAADGFHQTLTTALQNSKNPINAREILFKPVNKLVTRTLNVLNSTTASKQFKKDAKGLGDKIRGFGVKVKKLPDGTADPASVSKSHQSFVQRADTFKQLVTLLGSEVKYAPNETELQVVTLGTLATAMKTANDNIGGILAPVDNARISRNYALYEPIIGVVDVAQACKDYVKGAGGFNSPEAQLIKKIKFTRPRKKINP